jgi:hypothetical protein
MKGYLTKSQILAGLAVLTLTFFLVSMLAFLMFVPASRLGGDGRLVDRGFWSSRYRYTITFPRLIVSEGGKHTFVCKGVPWESWVFSLRAVDLEREPALERVGGVIAAFRLTDANGRVLCEVERPLRDWILQSSPGNTELTQFWAFETRDLAMHPGVEYTLSITLKNSAGVGPIELEPMLEAGGWRWP